MEQQYILKFIESISFFSTFSGHEKLKLISDKSSFKQFDQGTNIFNQGDEGSSLFVLLYGNIKLIKLSETDVGKERVSLKDDTEEAVGELESGSVFGEISLLVGRKRSVSTLVTSSKAVVMEISNKYIDSLNLTIQKKFHKQLLLELVKDLDDMDTRYLKLRSEFQTSPNLS